MSSHRFFPAPDPRTAVVLLAHLSAGILAVAWVAGFIVLYFFPTPTMNAVCLILGILLGINLVFIAIF